MAKKSLGFIQLEWTCPNCNSRNPGSTKTCENCGAPQPENVKFEAPAEKKFVEDENALKAAKAGADIHCGFCGTRNPATATTCSQCGGDLKEGKARESGRVMQTPDAAPKSVKCNNCGTENPGSERVCSSCGKPLPRAEVPAPVASVTREAGAASQKSNRTLWILGAVGGFLLLCCAAVVMMFFVPASSVSATVSNVEWKTFVPVQEVQAVNYSNERGSPPSDAYNISCNTKSEEVCEDKTVDQGNGYAEVVRECHTESEQYCDYTVDEWKTVQTYTLNGNDMQPVYDTPSIANGQKLGTSSEELTVYFSTDKGEKTYTPSSVSEFQQFQIGSTWTLQMNVMGGVVSVEK